jgi:hypothetical protein
MSYPDDMNWAAFDRAQGRDDDGGEARASEASAYAAAELAKMETIRAILRKAREDVLAVGLIEEWHGGYDKDGITTILAEMCEWDARKVSDHIFTKKMDELEGRE